MRWTMLIVVLACGAARDVDGAELRSASRYVGGRHDVRFAASPVAASRCGSCCTWNRYGSCPACVRRTRWAYHGPYYRRPYDYRRSFDSPWSYAPYHPAAYWVSDEASTPVDETPPPLPAR